MLVKAIALGFYGCLRQPGDEFEVADKDGKGKPTKATWFKPLDPKKPTKEQDGGQPDLQDEQQLT